MRRPLTREGGHVPQRGGIPAHPLRLLLQGFLNRRRQVVVASEFHFVSVEEESRGALDAEGLTVGDVHIDTVKRGGIVVSGVERGHVQSQFGGEARKVESAGVRCSPPHWLWVSYIFLYIGSNLPCWAADSTARAARSALK